MWIIGLTGSIGMGKTTAGRILKSIGVPVHDSDAAVHRAFAPGGPAVADIERQFPGTVADGVVDRQALGKIVFHDDSAIATLESILHPLVKQDRLKFIRRSRGQRRFAVAIDVPLLFETGTHRECDCTVVISAPASVQARRVLSRPGMTRERFEAVKARQMPDREKRRRADFVVLSHLGRRHTSDHLKHILLELWRASPPPDCDAVPRLR